MKKYLMIMVCIFATELVSAGALILFAMIGGLLFF